MTALAEDIAPDTEQAPPQSGAFNSMKDKLSEAMSQFGFSPAPEPKDKKPPQPAKKALLDKTPVDPPSQKKVEQGQPKPETPPAKTEPEAKPESDFKKRYQDALNNTADNDTKPTDTDLDNIAPGQVRAQHWKALRKSRDEQRERAEAAEKEIKTLRKTLDKERSLPDREKLARHNGFKSYYDGQLQQATARAAEFVGEDRAEEVKAVLAATKVERKAKLNALVGSLDETDRLGLITAIGQYDQIAGEMEGELQNASARLRVLEEREAETQKQEQARIIAERESLFGAALATAQAFDAFRPAEDDEHETQRQKDVDLLRRVVMEPEKVSRETLTALTIAASQGHRLMRVEVPKLRERISELEDALAKLGGASPRPGDGSGATTKPQPMGFIESYKANSGNIYSR